jgi:wyosine [tRNA(Phe)-imidazoG37] synthetase (radical SAM superfamily)
MMGKARVAPMTALELIYRKMWKSNQTLADNAVLQASRAGGWQVAGQAMSEANKMQATGTCAEVQAPEAKSHPDSRETKARAASQPTGFGAPRDFLDNRFVYVTVSARARGLSVGVNLNPDKECNFDCVYCEVDRHAPFEKQPLEVKTMGDELERALAFLHSGQLRRQPPFNALPEELLELRHVALSGDGEPTLCPQFAEALQSVIHIRARGQFPFFKIVLLTNATGLDLPLVENSLKLLTPRDEIWAKLDAGTQAFMERVNRPQVPLKKVLANILKLGRQRPVVIQSLFSLLDGQPPPPEEIEQYLERLGELKTAGAMIPLVQVYSPYRPMAQAQCGHLPLKNLSHIAKLIRAKTGLNAEVF